MKFRVAVGFEAARSLNREAAACLERPRMYIVGVLESEVKAFRVPSPMPLVAPTKTATSLELEVLKDALEERISERETILGGWWEIQRRVALERCRF